MERSPNQVLLEFVRAQPGEVRRNLLHQIAMHLGGWIVDNPNLAPLTLELITPSRWDERYSNTVLIAGLLDHIMNTLSEISVFEVMGGAAKVTSLTKAQCFAAREQWRALRADELAPAKLAELANYSDRD